MKILLKSMLHFSVYIVPYIFINMCILIIIAMLAVQFFKPEIYLSQALADQDRIDLFTRYLATTLQLVLVNNWGEIMSRCIAFYGSWVSVFFIVPAVLIKFFLENIMLSLFLHTYSETYWEYIKVQDNRIGVNFEKRGLYSRNAITRPDNVTHQPIKRLSSNQFNLEAIRKMVLMNKNGSPTRKSPLLMGPKSPSGGAKLTPPRNDKAKKSTIVGNPVIDQLEGEFIDPLRSDYCEFIQDIDTLGLPVIRTKTQLDKSKSFFDKPDASEAESDHNTNDLKILEALERIGEDTGKNSQLLDVLPVRGANKGGGAGGFGKLSEQRISSMDLMKTKKSIFLQVAPADPFSKQMPSKARSKTSKDGTPKSKSSAESSRKSSRRGSRKHIDLGSDRIPGLESPRSGVESTRKIGDKLIDLKVNKNHIVPFSPRNRLETETTRNLMTEENQQEQFSTAEKAGFGALWSPREAGVETHEIPSPKDLKLKKNSNLALRGFRKKSAIMPVAHSSLLP